jgi:septin family protein
LIKVEISKTVDIKVQSVDLEEKGVRLRLTIVDTPGFGDLINADKWQVFWCCFNSGF